MQPMQPSKLVRLFHLCWIAICALVGCNDLPDTNYPLLPTPSGEVVCQDDGRGGYDWKLENGKFLVTKPLESSLFLAVDEERVRALLQQASSNPQVPAYQPPEWVDKNLRGTIEACIRPSDRMPVRIVSLTSESLPRMTDSNARLALNQDGSRLLIVDDKLTLWDTSRGELLKELPSPTKEPTFAFLTPAGDEAFIFDSHRGYRLSFAGEAVSSTEVSTREIQQIVTSDERDVFFIHTDSEVVRLNADLQVVSTPALSLSDEGLLSVSADGDYVATFDRGEFSLFNLVSKVPPLSHVINQNAPVKSLVTAPNSKLLAVFTHDIRSISLRPASIQMQGLVANTGLTVDCQTTFAIDRALPITDRDRQLSPWVAVCVQRAAREDNAGEYQVYDVNVEDRLVSLPSTIGSRRPELLTMSGDGRVFASANANEPVNLYIRGPRLIKHAELESLIESIASLIMEGHHDKGEELVESLESYAASVPYTLGTRQLLDLKSPIAKSLVMSCIEANPNELKSELKAWIETGSTLAKLVQAMHLASQQLTGGKEAWDKTNEEARALVDEILSSHSPPTLAFEIMAKLTWTMRLDAGPLSTHFAAQLERDPLNSDLHLCMASYHTFEKAGDIGQPEAYLAKVCELLPADQRDAFYTLQSFKIQQALLPPNTMQPARNRPALYDLINRPYQIVNMSFYDAINPDSARVAQGLNNLLQPNSFWGKEFPQSLWPELIRRASPGLFPSSGEMMVVDAYLRTYPFIFNDAFTSGQQMRGAFQKKLLGTE